jgi:pumilio homology domain family member 6
VLFVQHVGEEITVAMCTEGACNGAFVVAELCEALMIGGDARKGGERERVKGWFAGGGGVRRKTVEDGSAKGKKVLLEKLERL